MAGVQWPVSKYILMINPGVGLGSSGRLSLNLSMWRTIASLISPPSHHQPTVSLLVKRMTELSTSGLQDVYFQIFGTSILQGGPKNVHTRLFNFILFLSVIFIGL